MVTLPSEQLKNSTMNVCDPFKDVHRRQKLTTDFFKLLLELTILVVNISISRKKYAYRSFQGVIFLRGLITKS